MMDAGEDAATGGRVKSGIYIITNTRTGDCYIGSSTNIEKRLTQHRVLLRLGRHHSRQLQEAWARYGEGAFVFDVLETVPDRNQLVVVEQRYLDERRPAYNPARIALRNGAGIVSTPDEIERRRKLAWHARRELSALYEEVGRLRASEGRADDIMKVLAVARALSPEDRASIEESADLAAALYREGLVSGRAYLDLLAWLSQHCIQDEQVLVDDWGARGLEPHEVDALLHRLQAYVDGVNASPLPAAQPAPTLTELTRCTLWIVASTVARELHVSNDSHGFTEVSSDVDVAGRIVGDTRHQIEAATGRPVVSSRNMLRNPDAGLWEISAATEDTEESE